MGVDRPLRYRDRLFPRNLSVWVKRASCVLLWHTRTGCCYAGRCLPLVSETADAQYSELWALIHGGPMKRKDIDKVKSARVHADASGVKENFPNLAEFLTAAVFEGSKERRESPTVTIWATGGTWRASVKDRAEGLVLWLSAPHFGELLAMLEDFCLSAEAPWRHDDQSHERNGKRVKKAT